MAETAPPICQRIRAARLELKDQHGTEYSQEKVAQRVGVSLKAYRAYEKDREPGYERRKAIARALGYAEDFFEIGTPDLARVEGQYEELLEGLRRVEDRLSRLELPDDPEEPRSDEG